jgi:spermidine synthase
MLPRLLIDSAIIPGGSGTLRLMQRGSEFSILLGNNELMNSRLSGSEEALARLSCGAARSKAQAVILIGGLGMGFTLRAALLIVGVDAKVTVAEVVPEVEEWARGPMAHVHGDSLDDPRVRIVIADVAALIEASRDTYDVIILDVDNGPDGLTRAANDRLYGLTGLRTSWQALRPGGVLAIWSCAPDRAFTDRLCKTGFTVDEAQVRAHQGRSGARHTIWCATKAATAA